MDLTTLIKYLTLLVEANRWQKWYEGNERNSTSFSHFAA